jgi:hypothetical protein
MPETQEYKESLCKSCVNCSTISLVCKEQYRDEYGQAYQEPFNGDLDICKIGVPDEYFSITECSSYQKKNNG